MLRYLHVAPNQCLRLGPKYRRLGTIATPATKVAPEGESQRHALLEAESTLSRKICSTRRLPPGLRISVANNVRAALLYAASEWANYTKAAVNKVAIAHSNPLRRAVDGRRQAAEPKRQLSGNITYALSGRPGLLPLWPPVFDCSPG